MSPHPERLLVLWHDRRNGLFFTIARLERNITSPRYVFRYHGDVFQEAHEYGLEPLLAFPDVGKIYKSDHLFPFFENRLMRKSRPDYAEYVQMLGLDPTSADEMAILGRSGGERATDSFLLMNEPKAVDKDRSELYFWATAPGRTNQSAWQNLSNLKPGMPLKIGEPDLLLHEEKPVGRLPEYVRALIPQHKPFPGTPEVPPEISVVSKNPLSPRRMLLCHLVFRPDPARPLTTMMGIPEEQSHIDSRVNRPRAVIGKRLPHDLESLVVHLCEGNLPVPPAFSRPINGVLFDKPLHDPEMSLEWSKTQCCLVLKGTDVDHFYERMPAQVGRRYETHLDLEDGSTVYAHSAGSFGTDGPHKNWRCQLDDWQWSHIKEHDEPLRYWVGLLPNASLDYQWMNLGVTTLNSEGLRGLHVPGTPSITLVQVYQYDSQGTRQPGLAVIVQANDVEGDIGRNLYKATNVLSAVTGIDEPPVFYGFNNALTVSACFARGRLKGKRDASWLPVLPLSGEKHRRELRWPIPFLRCLRDKVFDAPHSDELHLALVWFRFVLEEPYWESQAAKMGVVLRLLLRWRLDASAADWLDPKSVSSALSRLVDRAKLNLPPDASATLELSHRMAVLGDRGIPGSQFPALDDYFSQTDRWGPVKETLRVTFATLLAEAIGYHGPVVGQLHPSRGLSVPHDPHRDDVGHERIEQEAEARATFVAGDPDAFPW